MRGRVLELPRCGTSTIGLRRRNKVGFRQLPAKKILLHLGHEEFARAAFRQGQLVLIDEPCLVRNPFRPGLTGNLLKDALPQVSGQRGTRQTFCIDIELNAADDSGHASFTEDYGIKGLQQFLRGRGTTYTGLHLNPALAV